MRLFIAINFDAIVRGDLAAVSDELRRRSAGGVFALPENLHLTLAFLGECDHYQMSAACVAMDAVTFDSFELRIEGIGQFKRPNPRSGDIWWADVKKSEPLLRLQKDLARQLRDAGFDLEHRKYKPHVTLGRQITLSDRIAHGGLLGVSVSQQVEQLELMQSERIAGRLTYTPLHSITARDVRV